MEGKKILENIKVLYVEDEIITRSYVSEFLKKKIGKVIIAENGEDGIKKFMEHRPDIIIADLVMPDMSGIDMLKKIRMDGARCPFIITSALSDTNIILQTVDLKIEKYIIKPIDVNVLMKTLVQIAIEEAEHDHRLLVIDHEFLLTEERRAELELEIRNLYAAYLKRVIGKGAKLIQVLIRGKEIEVYIKENLTTMEESLLRAGNHSKSIEVIRKTIYENTLMEVQNQIGDLVKRRVTLNKLEICPIHKYERVVFVVV